MTETIRASLRGVAILAALVTLGGSSAPALAQTQPDDEGLSPMARSAVEQKMQAMKLAYDLTDDQMDQLYADLVAAYQETDIEARQNLDLMHAMEQQLPRSADGQIDENSEQAQEYLATLLKIGEASTRSDDTVLDKLETRLPPQQAEGGRTRFAELSTREGRMRLEKENDANQAAGRGQRMVAAVVDGSARQTPMGRPMPRGNRGDGVAKQREAKTEKRVVQPNRDVAAQKPEVVKASRDDAKGKDDKAAADRLAAMEKARADAERKAAQQRADQPQGKFAEAPPLDEWDRHVATVAEHYGFDDAQVRKAQSILADLRKRAYQYRMSRANQIAQAKLMTDDKARDTRLKELNEPIDALFDELKARLDALATTAQRHAAKAATSKSGSKR